MSIGFLILMGCGPSSPPRSVTDKEFTDLPIGFFHSSTRGTINVEGSDKGGTISIEGPAGTQEGEWTLPSPGVKSIDHGSGPQEVPFTLGGGLDVTVNFSGQAPDTWGWPKRTNPTLPASAFGLRPTRKLG